MSDGAAPHAARPVSSASYPPADDDPDSAVTLGELHRRLAELQIERTWRIAFAAFVASALACAAALFALVIAL
jgi:hypothetical protein